MRQRQPRSSWRRSGSTSRFPCATTSGICRSSGAGQSIVHQHLAPAGDTYWVQMQNAFTTQIGTMVAINDTAPAGDLYNLAAVEILP
jgi:hypothetical protein